MKVFFLASIAVSKELRRTYLDIISIVESQGHIVIANQSLISPKSILKNSIESNEKRGKNLLKEMLSCDCVVFEGTQSTTGGGYYLSVALQRSMPVLFLTQEEYKGLYLATYNRLLKIKQYFSNDKINMKKIITDFFIFSNKKSLSNRFNMMISDSMNDFLDNFSKQNGISKADFIRDLVYSKMEEMK